MRNLAPTAEPRHTHMPVLLLQRLRCIRLPRARLIVVIVHATIFEER